MPKLGRYIRVLFGMRLTKHSTMKEDSVCLNTKKIILLKFKYINDALINVLYKNVQIIHKYIENKIIVCILSFPISFPLTKVTIVCLYTKVSEDLGLINYK